MGKKKSSSNKAGEAQVALQREQVQKQYEYDKAQYDFMWEGTHTDPSQAVKQWRHQRDSLVIQKNNDEQNKTYQEETSRRNWEHSINIQDYKQLQALRMFEKSEQTAGDQFVLNRRAAQAAVNRENEVLNEQFINAAFENQGLIQDLYETVGGKGFDQASALLNLKKTEGEADYRTTQQLTNLSQKVGAAQFDKAGTELGMLDKAGKVDFTKASVAQDLAAKEAQSKLSKLEQGITVKGAKAKADYENEIIRRSVSNEKAKSAYQTTEQNVEALQRLGQASLTQSGRSQGKSVQMVLAALGRQNAYTVETLVRGKSAAEARAKENSRTALDVETKARIASKKIDMATLDNIATAKLNVEEADRDLKISQTKGTLDLDEIKRGIMNATDTAGIETKEIARNLDSAQTRAGFDFKKIDWDIDNLGSRFKTNQHILKAQLDSAVKSSILNKKDIMRNMRQANLEAEARRMLFPQELPDIPAPLELPDLEWQDPLFPDKPPAPIKGAMAQHVSTGGGGTAGVMSSVMGGVSTGLAAASMLPGIGTVGAVAVGLGSMFF